MCIRDSYNAYEVAELDSKPEYGTWVFDQELQSLNPVSGESLESLCEGTFTHLFDDAVADATSGLIPPGDCGNSEEEAFKAGVNSVYFYTVGEVELANYKYSSTSGGWWADWFNGDGLLKNAMNDYLNGRCSDVDESLYPEFNFLDTTGGTFEAPMTCESFKCRPDNDYRYADTRSSVAWGVFPESAAIYCSNVDDEHFFGE